MKRILLLALVLHTSVLTNAQNKNDLRTKLPESKFLEEHSKDQANLNRDWSLYNVFFRETFDSVDWHTASNNGVAVPGNMPQGWSAVDNTGNDFFWRWSTQGPRGCYTSPGDSWDTPNEYYRLKSTSDQTTSQRGFMMMESDYYNTDQNGLMVNTPVEMDSYIQYGPIDLSDAQAVSIYFEQFHRLCCNSFAEGKGLKLFISVDNENWTEIAVHQSSVGATPRTNPSILEMRISSLAAGHSTVYFRFHKLQMSHYYWMIDDIYIFEPPTYETRVLNYWVDYAHGSVGEITDINFPKLFSITPFYTPFHSFQNIVSSRSKVVNIGIEPLTDVIMTTSIKNSDNEVIYSTSSSPIEVVNYEEVVNMEAAHNYQIPTTIDNIGNYQYIGEIVANEDIPTHFNDTYLSEFNITNNLYGYANPLHAETDITSPYEYISGVDGDGVGMVVMLDPPLENIEGTTNPAPHELVGVNVFINDDENNNTLWRSGNVANFQVDIYEGDLVDDEYTFNVETPVVTSDLIPIDSSFRNTWAFIPFQNIENANLIIPSTIGMQYLVLVRMFTNNANFFIGADNITQPSLYSNWVSFGDIVQNTTSTKNASMELIVDSYGTNNSSDIQFTFLNYATAESGSPVSGAVLTFYSNDSSGTQIIDTFTSNASGYATVPNLRSGTYSYKVEYQGEIRRGSVTAIGRDETVEISFNLANVEPHVNLYDVTLYPNPANNSITISMNNIAEKIVITNVLGKTIQAYSNISEFLSIDIQQYNIGIYFVSLYFADGNKTTKMLIKQ